MGVTEQLQRLEGHLRWVMAVVIILAFTYVGAWVLGTPPWWLSVVWIGVALTVVPMLCVLQVLCFILLPRQGGIGVALDLASVLMVHLMAILGFSTVYHYWIPGDFGIPGAAEVEAGGKRLEEIEKEKRTQWYARAEIEEGKRARIEGKINDEVMALVESVARAGLPWIDLPAERARSIRQKREAVGIGGTPLTFGEQQRRTFFEQIIRKKYETDLGQLDTRLLASRSSLLSEFVRLREAIERHSFLNVVYFASAASVEVAPTTARGKLWGIGQRVWTFFLLIVYLTAVQIRGRARAAS